jgi:hypothetical protein
MNYNTDDNKTYMYNDGWMKNDVTGEWEMYQKSGG